MRTALLLALAATLAAGPAGAVAPPIPPDCFEASPCVLTQRDVATVSVEPLEAVVGGAVVARVTPVLPPCPVPPTEEAIAAVGRCGAQPIWGFGADFLDNFAVGEVDASPVGACDGTTLACTFRVDAVTAVPGNPDPLPGWLTIDLRLSWVRYDGDRPPGSRIVRETAEVDAPFWGVREPPTAIRIVKTTLPEGMAQPFTFDGSLGAFVLDTDPATAPSDAALFADVAPGHYVVAERVPAGWRLTGLDCADPSGGTTIDFETATVSIAVEAGETVTCTFEDTQAGGGFFINSTGDGADADAGDGVCATGGTIERDGVPEAECTLRAAIEEANALAGADAIGFDIPDEGVPRIEPGGPLPPVMGTAAIDGRTQPAGFVELSGAGAEAVGLDLVGRGSSVRGLVVNGFGVAGLRLGGEGEHTVAGNRVGTDVDGAAAAPNEVGIMLAADGNTIGGLEAGGPDEPCLGTCNLISGNVRGVDSNGTWNRTRIVGNFVGTDVTGLLPLGNTTFGVRFGADRERLSDLDGLPALGGPTARPGTTPGNLVAANGEVDVVLFDGRMEGNLVGTDRTGARALGAPIGVDGEGDVAFVGGGDTPGGPAGNVISGHSRAGIRDGGFARIQGNLIGTDIDGEAAVPNLRGIEVAFGYQLGRTEAVGNLVSGNDVGIGTSGPEEIDPDGGFFPSLLAGNRIGTNARGDAALPNRIGVDLGYAVLGPSDDAPCGTPCNLVSGNLEAGVRLFAGVLEGNAIGTDVTGQRAIPNGGPGVLLGTDDFPSFASTRVGGPSGATAGDCGGPCNRIAGNLGPGLRIADRLDVSITSDVPALVQGNAIGVAADGTPLPNGGDGVQITGRLPLRGIPATGPTLVVGGDAAGAGNVIARNGNHGVAVFATAHGEPRGVTVTRNVITDNGAAGIFVDPAFTNAPALLSAQAAGGGLVAVTGSVALLDLSPHRVDLYANAACDPAGAGEGAVFLGTTQSSGLDGRFALTVALPAGATVLTATATSPAGSTSAFSDCLEALVGGGLAAPAAAGATVVDVAGAEQLAGRVVRLNEGGPNEETNLGVLAASLRLAKPLRFAHAAGEPVVAADDTLFVSVERAVAIRGARPGRDALALDGTFTPIPGAQARCREEVRLTFGEFAETIPGGRFLRLGHDRCFHARLHGAGVRAVLIDFRRGTWQAVVERVTLGGLAAPVEVSLGIGDDEGLERIFATTFGPLMIYDR